MTINHTILHKALTALVLMSVTAGCSSTWEDEMVPAGNGSGSAFTENNRIETEETRKVLLLYSCGYNDLRSYLQGDIEELKQGWLPTNLRRNDAVVVYSHAAVSTSDFKTETTPYLIHLYSDNDGKVIADTLITYPSGTRSASAQQINRVLSDVKRNFTALSYGMIFSSHATGFLPQGFYSNPSSYKFQELKLMSAKQQWGLSPVPYEMPEHDPSYPKVKSVGADMEGSKRPYQAYEIDLRDFAEAIPIKLDYILFDACLMGGIEVAYELKDKCKRVGFSQAEVLADGLNYTKLTEHLIKKEQADPKAVCEDYFSQYDKKTGLERSATISLVNTEYLDELASACAPLFEKYREQIKSLSKSRVQGFGGGKNYFFDLVDVVRSAGADNEEIGALRQAVDRVMIYKAATDHYYSATDRQTHRIDQNKFSGLSMHMPGKTESELDKYYRTLSWNMATELVE